VCKGADVLRAARPVVALGAVAVLAAACGGGGGGDSASKRAPSTTAPATTASSTPATTAAGGVRITAAPWKLPSPSSREVVLTDGKQLIVLGGLDASKQTTGSVVSVDPSNGASQTVGTLAQPVHDAAGAFVNGAYVVIAGGTGEEGSASVQSFQPGAAKAVGSVPGPLSDHASATIDGKVYVVGGYDGHQISPNVLVSDDGAHYRILGALAEPVRYPAVAATGGAIYVFGGVATASGADTRSIQKIDPGSGKVSVVGQLPAPLSHASAVELGGRIYVLGGFVANQVTGQVLRFEPQSGTVAEAGTLPVPVTDGAVTRVGDTAYLVGGQGTDRAPLATVVELKGG